MRLGARPYTTLERDYADAAHRYAHLYLSADFAKLVMHWPQVRPVPTYYLARCLLPIPLHVGCGLRKVHCCRI